MKKILILIISLLLVSGIAFAGPLDWLTGKYDFWENLFGKPIVDLFRGEKDKSIVEADPIEESKIVSETMAIPEEETPRMKATPSLSEAPTATHTVQRYDEISICEEVLFIAAVSENSILVSSGGESGRVYIDREPYTIDVNGIRVTLLSLDLDASPPSADLILECVPESALEEEAVITAPEEDSYSIRLYDDITICGKILSVDAIYSDSVLVTSGSDASMVYMDGKAVYVNGILVTLLNVVPSDAPEYAELKLICAPESDLEEEATGTAEEPPSDVVIEQPAVEAEGTAEELPTSCEVYDLDELYEYRNTGKNGKNVCTLESAKPENPSTPYCRFIEIQEERHFYDSDDSDCSYMRSRNTKTTIESCSTELVSQREGCAFESCRRLCVENPVERYYNIKTRATKVLCCSN